MSARRACRHPRGSTLAPRGGAGAEVAEDARRHGARGGEHRAMSDHTSMAWIILAAALATFLTRVGGYV